MKPGDQAALDRVTRALLSRFSEGAAKPTDHPGLAAIATALTTAEPLATLHRWLPILNRDGYLRDALVLLAAHQRHHPRAEVLLIVAHELCDAIAPDLGIELARIVLTLPNVERDRWQPHGPYIAANLLLGEQLLHEGDPLAAVRHFEAVLAMDIDHARALRGYQRAAQHAAASPARLASRGLAMLEGLDDIERTREWGDTRYTLGRPLGRGRHAVVYSAFDRRVGRDVALKRLALDRRSGLTSGAVRALHNRFFAEAQTLARVRSPYVVALLDVQPAHGFIALSLCRGGNLRVATRRGIISAYDVPRLGYSLLAALRDVHAVGAVHRDIKPANILVRHHKRGAEIALADFGLAQVELDGADHAGTLRYLAPELRQPGIKTLSATPASDIFSAGVVLLELALGSLPNTFDQITSDLGAADLVPDGLDEDWSGRLRAMLDPSPAARFQAFDQFDLSTK